MFKLKKEAKSMSKPIRFWNFTNTASEGVVLRLDGDIIDDDWAWIYDWLGMPAASPNAFRSELAKYAGKSITLWIDSYGGSVYAGVGIYNALMEHKASGVGVKITSVGDSHIMSAATLPYLAGDDRLLTPGAVFMVHKPLADASGYATDLRKTADVLDTIEESIINIYALSTGIPRERLAKLMAGETYMGASMAIKEGFATGMKYAKDEEKSSDVMNFSFNRQMVLNVTNSANDSVKKFFEMLKEKQKAEGQNSANQTDNPPVANKISNEGSTDMEIKTVDDLKKAYPELVNQIETAARDQGASTERDRIKNIEAISKNIDPTLVNKSKFETPIDAKELAFQAMQANAAKSQQYLADHATDVTNSKTNTVTSAAGEGEHTSTENVEIHNAAQKIAKNFRS
jgi:ATP-dependent protease ClpP protease subunit